MSMLVQNLRTIKGLRKEQVKELGTFKNYEVLTEEDISSLVELTMDENIGVYISGLLYDNVLEIPEIASLIDLLNLKRLFKYSLDGEDYYLVLPSKREITSGVLNHMNSMLIKVAKAYYEYAKSDIEEKDDRYAMFMNLRHKLILMIESEVFSKDFKKLYRMKFKGITGVCLTGNVSINGIQIPLWYAKKYGIQIGDIGIVFRDPVQNLIIALQVEGFTENEIRVHSKVFVLLGGDHDGDKCQFIPLKSFLKENVEYTGRYTLNIVEEVHKLLPSNIFTDDSKFLPMFEHMDYNFTKQEFSTPHTMLDMLHESKKSMKYAGTINEQDYLDNQASTVLNMRTVKEGTAFAGAFANWIFEKARVHGYDLVLARHLGDLIQQEALDSKHTTGGKGFMDSQWYKLVSLKNSCYRDNYDEILKKIEQIMNNTYVEPEDKDDCNSDFDI